MSQQKLTKLLNHDKPSRRKPGAVHTTQSERSLTTFPYLFAQHRSFLDRSFPVLKMASLWYKYLKVGTFKSRF